MNPHHLVPISPAILLGSTQAQVQLDDAKGYASII